ncbi:MAG: riboflavin synthase [Bacteroidota bacterium]|nr:riboflavin synthase [Bacteroidota bacterium]
MFTGIIEDVGHVLDSTPCEKGLRLRVQTRLASELAQGQSISVNGVCQTVVHTTDMHFEVIAIAETLRKTNLGLLRRGAPVNLERALQLGARLDGHLVQGHVDAACPVVDVSARESDRWYTLEYPDSSSGLVIETGSVAVDGISLTIARQQQQQLTVAIVPHTYENTNVRTWQPGTTCNIEFDVLGKYAARQLRLIPAA